MDNEPVSKSGKSITENKIDQLKLPLAKKDNAKETSIKENNQEFNSTKEVSTDIQLEDNSTKQNETISYNVPTTTNTSQGCGGKEEVKSIVKPTRGQIAKH